MSQTQNCKLNPFRNAHKVVKVVNFQEAVGGLYHVRPEDVRHNAVQLTDKRYKSCYA